MLALYVSSVSLAAVTGSKYTITRNLYAKLVCVVQPVLNQWRGNLDLVKDVRYSKIHKMHQHLQLKSSSNPVINNTIKPLQRCNVKVYFVSFIGYRTLKCIFSPLYWNLYNLYCYLIYLTTTSAELQERKREGGQGSGVWCCGYQSAVTYST